jgi:hypothetical protein
MVMRVIRASLLAVAAALALAGPAGAVCGPASRPVTVDFSTAGEGTLAPGVFRSAGLVLPSSQCGTFGCHQWFVGFVFGDEALTAGEATGPVRANFTLPVTDVSVLIVPDFQFRASYTLTAYDIHGKVAGRRTVEVNQDSGLPNSSPFGYFALSVDHLKKPACSFSLTSKWIASSFPSNVLAEFAVSTIAFGQSTGRGAGTCEKVRH